MKKVLLLGSSGQLGREVASRAPADIDFQPFNKTELDITLGSDVDRVITGCDPDTVINTAAYTQVDKAESEPEHAFAVNVGGVEGVTFSVQPVTGVLGQDISPTVVASTTGSGFEFTRLDSTAFHTNDTPFINSTWYSLWTKRKLICESDNNRDREIGKEDQWN